MQMVEHIEGLLAAPFVPLDQDGQLNTKVIPQYAEFLHQNKIVGVFVNGTSGEGFSLTTKERMALAEAWMNSAPTGFKVLIHVGHTSVEEAKALASHAQDIGVYGIGSTAPIFFKPGSIYDLINHNALEAAAAPNLPFYYYHIPQLTGVDFPMIDYVKNAPSKIPNFVGIKYSKFELSDYRLCVDYDNGNYDILFGQDETILSALSMGARGAIGSTYNYNAPLTLAIMDKFAAGNISEAAILQTKAIEIVKTLARTGCYMAAAKIIMGMLGIDLGIVRSPLKNLSPEIIATFQTQLEQLNFSEWACKLTN
jgi:N-acetylneuraminate lyase